MAVTGAATPSPIPCFVTFASTTKSSPICFAAFPIPRAFPLASNRSAFPSNWSLAPTSPLSALSPPWDAAEASQSRAVALHASHAWDGSAAEGVQPRLKVRPRRISEVLDRRLARFPGPFLHAPPPHHASVGFDGYHRRRLAHRLRQPRQSHACARFGPRERNRCSPRHGRHPPAHHRTTLDRESFSLRARRSHWSRRRLLGRACPHENLSAFRFRRHQYFQRARPTHSSLQPRRHRLQRRHLCPRSRSSNHPH